MKKIILFSLLLFVFLNVYAQEKTYTDSEHGYTINYPSHWYVKDVEVGWNPPVFIIPTSEQSRKTVDSIKISVFVYEKENKNLKEVVDKDIEDAKTLPGYKLFKLEKTQIGRKEAYCEISEIFNVIDNIEVKQKIYSFFSNSQYFTVGYRAPVEDFEKHLATADKIIHSMHIIE